MSNHSLDIAFSSLYLLVQLHNATFLIERSIRNDDFLGSLCKRFVLGGKKAIVKHDDASTASVLASGCCVLADRLRRSYDF